MAKKPKVLTLKGPELQISLFSIIFLFIFVYLFTSSPLVNISFVTTFMFCISLENVSLLLLNT